MLVLEIKSERLAKARSGEKTKTFREGVRNYPLGDAILINSEDKSDTQFITVKSVRSVKLSNLREEDVSGAEYHSLSEFVVEMTKIYPNLNQDSMITIVEFENQELPQLSPGVQRGA